MDITIIPYSPSDLESVDKLFLELQVHENKFDSFKSTKPENAQKYKNELLETINKQHGELLVAKDGNKVLGLVAWFLEEEYEFDEPYGYISDIVVAEKYRGKGIGQQLLDTAILHIKDTDVKRIHIGVLLANSETKDFYLKNGFTEYSIELVKELK
jgi:ribosomal protein S18 acetylase RimI-like enzyme